MKSYRSGRFAVTPVRGLALAGLVSVALVGAAVAGPPSSGGRGHGSKGATSGSGSCNSGSNCMMPSGNCAPSCPMPSGNCNWGLNGPTPSVNWGSMPAGDPGANGPIPLDIFGPGGSVPFGSDSDPPVTLVANRGPLVRGVINYPGVGRVGYVYNRATNVVSFPALRVAFNLNQRAQFANAYRNYGYVPSNANPYNGLWQQNGAVGQSYGNQGFAYRNSNLGQGMIYWPGMSAEDIIGSFTR